jgi:hypothetical protein
MAYVVHAIKNHGGTGETNFYLYRHYREGGKVRSQYLRPASSKSDKPKATPHNQ